MHVEDDDTTRRRTPKNRFVRISRGGGSLVKSPNDGGDYMFIDKKDEDNSVCICFPLTEESPKKYQYISVSMKTSPLI